MKKGVVLSIIGLACLLTGFVLFILKQKVPSLFFTLCGIGVYLYKLKEKKKLFGDSS